jgi:hypothetical protein
MSCDGQPTAESTTKTSHQETRRLGGTDCIICSCFLCCTLWQERAGEQSLLGYSFVFSNMVDVIRVEGCSKVVRSSDVT